MQKISSRSFPTQLIAIFECMKIYGVLFYDEK